MSGAACEIIIHGNFLQALMHAAQPRLSRNDAVLTAQAVGNALSLCQTGTLVYDGNEAMSDGQQAQAIDLMVTLNRAAAGIVLAHGDLTGPARDKLLAAITAFNLAAVDLLRELLPPGVDP